MATTRTSGSSARKSTGSAKRSTSGTKRKTATTKSGVSPAASVTHDVGLAAVMERLGVDSSVVETWRNHAKETITSQLRDQVEDFDINDALDRAREYASLSSEKVREISKKNPKAFYSGLAAVLVGAGLIATAAAKASRSKKSSSSSAGSASSSGASPRKSSRKRSSRKSASS